MSAVNDTQELIRQGRVDHARLAHGREVLAAAPTREEEQ